MSMYTGEEIGLSLAFGGDHQEMRQWMDTVRSHSQELSSEAKVRPRAANPKPNLFRPIVRDEL